MKHPLAALVLAFLTTGLVRGAEPIDISKGLGKLDWGISRDEAWQRVAGQGATLKKEKEYNGGYEEEAIIATKGDISTRYSFFQGQLFAFTRYISTPLDGYVTKEDLEQAGLGKQAEQLFKPAEGIKVEGSYQTHGHSGGRIPDVTVVVKATNERLYNELMEKLRAKNPNFTEKLIAPLGGR